MKDFVNVNDFEGKTTRTVELPGIFKTPISQHIIQETFRRMNMDKRQPYAVSPLAGMQHSAEGWGTGRAVARVPRVKGSGTRRSGQAAFANFARKGRLAHPTKVTRKWHRKVTLNERIHALTSGFAASIVPSLVESRGHQIENISSIPLVISKEIHNIKKTKEAFAVLKNLGLEDEIKRVKENKKLRAGYGKMRNRRRIKKRGVLLIHKGEELKAFRNIPGVEIRHLSQVSVLDVCPGGHAGRLILWTDEAFENVEEVTKVKENYREQQKLYNSDDLTTLFYSPEVQALVEVKQYKGEMVKKQDPESIMSMNPYLEKGIEMGIN
ncbi:60S ribosomal protein L4 [Binucleata daphniae]